MCKETSLIHSRGIEWRAALAFPALGLIIRILDPHMGLELAMDIGMGSGYLGGLTWNTSITFVLTVWWTWSYSHQGHPNCLPFYFPSHCISTFCFILFSHIYHALAAMAACHLYSTKHIRDGRKIKSALTFYNFFSMRVLRHKS